VVWRIRNDVKKENRDIGDKMERKCKAADAPESKRRRITENEPKQAAPAGKPDVFLAESSKIIGIDSTEPLLAQFMIAGLERKEANRPTNPKGTQLFSTFFFQQLRFINSHNLSPNHRCVKKRSSKFVSIAIENASFPPFGRNG
jgi:hypothetical protein